MTTWTWDGVGGVGKWTDPNNWINDTVPGTFGNPVNGDTVFFSGSFGLTINALTLTNIMNTAAAFNQTAAQTSTGINIQSSTLATGNVLNVVIGQPAGAGFSADIFGGLRNDGIINVGSGTTSGHADFSLVQTVPFTTSPLFLNNGTINVPDGEFQLEDGSSVSGVFDNEGQIVIGHSGSGSSYLLDDLINGSTGLLNNGSIVINGGISGTPLNTYAWITGPVTNSNGKGVINLTSGGLYVEPVSPTVFSVGETIVFGNDNGLVALGSGELASGLFQAHLQNFQLGDTIDLGTLATSFTLNGNGTVDLFNGSSLIGSLNISEARGFNSYTLVAKNSTDTLLLPVSVPGLFTTGPDAVDFNNLTPAQQTAIQKAPASIYDGLGGNDVVTLPNVANYGESVGNGQTLNWNPTQTFSTESLPGQSYSVTGGDGNDNIALGAGADNVTIDGNGNNTITGGSGTGTITINGTGTNTINLTGGAYTIVVTNPATASLVINGFAAGDTIFLPSITANESAYQTATGTLQLYDATYGQSISTVASLTVNGATANASFFVQPASTPHLGTMVTLGDAPPSLILLANFSSAVYANATSVGRYTQLLASPSQDGFLAVAYGISATLGGPPDQIVIAIRGTVEKIENNEKADQTFSSPDKGINPALAQYVLDASAFLRQVRETYPNASITLTGHSLGGALAALIGSASNYPTATFDAPGAAQLLPALSSELADAAAANSELPNGSVLPYDSSLPARDTDYRLGGDVVSRTGSQVGTVETINNPGNSGLLNYSQNHAIASLISALQNQPITSGFPASEGPLVVPAQQTQSGNTLTDHFLISEVVANGTVSIDPVLALSYQFTETAGSPLFSSVTLPGLPGVSSYNVSIETGTTWSAVQTLAPFVTLTPATPFDGLAFTPVDSSAAPVLAGSLTFDVTFATSGSFDGQLVMQVIAPTVSITNASGTVSQATQIISGTVVESNAADIDTVVTVLDGTTTIGTAIVQADGSWSTSVTLAAGLNSITATDIDLAGITGTSLPVVLNFGSAPPPTPTITGATPNPVEKNQQTVIATVMPGAAGDALTVKETTGAGSLSLGALQSNGTEQVIYTAPASIPASTTDAVAYTISENGASAAGTAAVPLDTGPSIAAQVPAVVAKTQTTVVGTVTPGIVGDTLTLTQASGSLGSLSLGAVQSNGTRQVIYTAPATINASAIDKVSYTVTDQHQDAVAAGSASVQLAVDAGPSVTLLPFVPGEANHAVTVAIGTPGQSGDTLSLVLTQAPQNGTVALLGNSVQFTSHSQSILAKPVTFSFELKDQFGATTPIRTVIVGSGLVNSVSGSASGNTDIGLGSGVNLVTLFGSGNVVDAGNGANIVSGGVSNNTVVLGNGLDSVKLSGGNNTITLGNGADAVSVGGSGNQIKLGSGIDVVHGGSGDTINLAKTTLSLYGTDEIVFLGSGNATINDFSVGLNVKIGPTAGVDVLSHLASDPSAVVDLIGGIGGFKTTAAVVAALKNDGHGGTLLSFGHGSSLDFTGVASTALHAANFKIG